MNIMQQWFAQAPSNIALIKYMGKLDEKKNIPSNPSLSYTLPNLMSHVKLEAYPGPFDIWEPLEIPGFKPLNLSHDAQTRYLQHLDNLKKYFKYEGHFIVRSSNNFPHASGLASSASSFAALTKCACLALSELTHTECPDVSVQAELSRMGSGSSCRSFFSPWAIWNNVTAEKIELPYNNLIHHAILISEEEKAISSKRAHSQVKSSPEYEFRPARARKRLDDLLRALQTKQWQNAYKICWDEFMDMHHLFETAAEPFTYFTPKTHEMLEILKAFWEENQDGPIVTMDAGPNIHLLFRSDQHELAHHFVHEYLVNQFDFI
jgi:diphosphomevalonate decarboxylase